MIHMPFFFFRGHLPHVKTTCTVLGHGGPPVMVTPHTQGKCNPARSMRIILTLLYWFDADTIELSM